MIKLHGFGEQLGVKDASPFVLKVQTYLQMAGIEYECNNGMESFKKAPRGMLPFIEDGDQIITDSYFIIEYLKNHYVDLDQHLSERQKAQAYMIQQTLDNILYECMLYTRWQGENWSKIKEEFFKNLPAIGFIRSIIAIRSQKRMLCRLNHHTNKYSKEELLQIAGNIFQSLSVSLGGNIYMFNNQVSSADAVCFAHLAQFILFEIKNPFSEKAENYQDLVDYCYNIQKQFFA